MFHKLTSLILNFVLMNGVVVAGIRMRSTSATLEVIDSAHLILDQAIINFSGTLVHENDASIQGLPIVFNNGMLDSSGTTAKLTGNIDPSAQNNIIKLTGAQTFKGVSASASQQILVSGQSNRIEGEISLIDDIILQDFTTSLTLALSRRLNKNIVLNGGTLFFEEDLNFIDNKIVEGPGVVKLNNRKLILSGTVLDWCYPIYFDDANDIVLGADMHLCATMTFNGANTINGQGHILFLEEGGNLVIDRGSTLNINNLFIRNVSGNNIRCLDNDGVISLQSVSWAQDDNYSFTLGSFLMSGLCEFVGTSTFAYQSVMTTTIDKFSDLYIDRNVTFSYDPLNNKKNLIQFTDKTSGMWFNAANLHVTRCGMDLTQGRVIFSDQCTLFVEDSVDSLTLTPTNAGLTIGDNVSRDNDCKFDFTAGSLFEVQNGAFIYRNINPLSWKMVNVYSVFQMDSGSSLHLDQTLNLDKGRLRCSAQAEFFKSQGVRVVGDLEFF